jgi:membrane fusion protein (multidrug efflux system)
VARLQPGQMVRLMTDDNGGNGEAEIERIAPAVDPTTGTVKVTVAVRSAEGLRPGSFVRVGIVTDTHADTLVVPRSALVAEGRRWHLFRLHDDDPSQVELIEITRGFEEADRVEKGDPIVVTGASSLSDESTVEVLTETAGDAGEDEESEEEPSQEA